MTQKSWLLRACPQSIVDTVRQYGPIAFLADGGTNLTQMEVASIATNAISYLDEKVSNLTSFLSTSSQSDDGIDSVVYSFYTVGEANFGILQKTITHECAGTKPPTVVNGPIVDKNKAEYLVQTFNLLFGKNTDDTNYRFIIFSNFNGYKMRHFGRIADAVEYARRSIGNRHPISVMDCGSGGKSLWQADASLTDSQTKWCSIFSGFATEFVKEYEDEFMP